MPKEKMYYWGERLIGRMERRMVSYGQRRIVRGGIKGAVEKLFQEGGLPILRFMLPFVGLLAGLVASLLISGIQQLVQKEVQRQVQEFWDKKEKERKETYRDVYRGSVPE